MCNSSLQIHNPRAVRLLDTSRLGDTAGIILREHDMNAAASVAYAERMVAKATHSSMAADYAHAAQQLKAMVQS